MNDTENIIIKRLGIKNEKRKRDELTPVNCSKAMADPAGCATMP